MRVITRLGGGGPPMHVLLLERGLRARGYESVLVVGATDARYDVDMSYLLQDGDQVLTVPSLSRRISLLTDFGAFVQLCRLMRSFRPDIVHTHTAKAGVIARIAAYVSRVPIILHTYHGNVFREYFGPMGSWACRAIERLLGLLSTRICVLSPQQAREIGADLHVTGPDRIDILPLGLDLSNLARLQRVSRDPATPFRIAWLGRFVPVKNLQLLHAVVKTVIHDIPNAEFIIAGDGPERAQVEELASECPGKVRWTGWVREVGEIIGACDVVIQTSRNEGTPVALIQAMASGLPFVSTPAGGVIDMCVGLSMTGECGARWYSNCVLAPADPVAFSRALKRLESRPDIAHQMGAEARRFALNKFAADRLINDLDRLYLRLMDQRFGPVLDNSRSGSRSPQSQ